MQSVSGGLFQELQQQGEAQAEEPGRRSGAQGPGGRAVRAAASEESSTSITGRIPPSAESPFFVNATPSPPPPPPQRRRSSRERPPLLERRGLPRNESSLSQATCLQRSDSGQGAPSPASWPPSSPKISSQLVGGSAGPNAGLLNSVPDSIAEYKSRLRSMLVGTPLPAPSAPPHILALPPTPGYQQSHHSFSTISSITSEESYASSFAYSLRRSKPDLRLLRKGSKPSQHLVQKPSALKVTPDGPRSPSFYRPKVVEDTGVVESPTKDIVPPSALEKPMPLTLPVLLRSEPPIKPLRKVPTFRANPAESKRKVSAVALKATGSRPVLSRKHPAQHLVPDSDPETPQIRSPAKLSRQLRFEIPTRSEGDSLATPILQTSPRGFVTKKEPSAFHPGGTATIREQSRPTKRHYHDVTPPEDEPRTPETSAFQHGDSYFHTWGPDTMYSREFVPVRTPIRNSATIFPVLNVEPQAAKRGIAQELASRKEELHRTPTRLSTASASKKRKSSALFSILRKTAFRDGVEHNASESINSGRRTRPQVAPPETPQGQEKEALPSQPRTPGITVSSPADSHGGCRRSILHELRMPSYFSRPKMHRGDSEPSPALSPGHAAFRDAESTATTPEDGPSTPSSPRMRRHHRSSSEALSPMSTSRKRPEMRHRSTITGSDTSGTASRVSPGCSPLLPVAFEANTSTANAAVHSQPEPLATGPLASTTVVDFALRDLKAKSSQISTFQEPVPRKRSSLWAGVVHGLRRISSLGLLSPEKDFFDEEPRHHRPSILAKMSLPRLSLRSSWSSINVRNRKLVRKASCASHLLEQIDSEDEARDRNSHDEFPGHRRDSGSSPRLSKVQAIKPEDLIVTAFEQTPFSKRYYDSIRSEQQVIRALVDETMEEDDEADDEVVLGFEQNVPDHLPKSPLCPLHPKHKSGGKAICPLHSRYKPKKVLPSPMHRLEIVFDTRVELAKTNASSTGADGAELFLRTMRARTLEATSDSFFTTDRRQLQTSSMGSDGTESLAVQMDASDAWPRTTRRRRQQQSWEHRGRSFERGESAVDIRERRHQKRRR